MKTLVPNLPYNYRDPADPARQQLHQPKPLTQHVVKPPKPKKPRT